MGLGLAQRGFKIPDVAREAMCGFCQCMHVQMHARRRLAQGFKWLSQIFANARFAALLPTQRKQRGAALSCGGVAPAWINSPSRPAMGFGVVTTPVLRKSNKPRQFRRDARMIMIAVTVNAKCKCLARYSINTEGGIFRQD